MTVKLRTSRAGLELIKSFEGFRARAIKLPDGRWTIGHGHVRSAREGVRISHEDAEALLIYDLKRIETEIEDCLLTPLNQNQYNAVVSFVYNISPGQFRQSQVLRLLNQGEHTAAAYAMEAWRRARINGKVVVVDALMRRRAAEKALFLEHPEGRVLCPTPLIPPQIDPNWQTSIVPPEPGTDFNAGQQGALEQSVADMTSAVEALALSSEQAGEAAKPPALKPITPSIQPVASAVPKNGRAVHRTPEDAVAELKERISKVLEREEASIAAKTAATETPEVPPPARVAAQTVRSEKISRPIHDDHERDETEASFKSIRPSGFQVVKQPEAGASAFELSRIMAEKDVHVAAAHLKAEAEPMTTADLRDDTEKAPVTDHAPRTMDASAPEDSHRNAAKLREAEELTETAVFDRPVIKPDLPTINLSGADEDESFMGTGRAIWGVLTLGALALMAWGVFDFFMAAQSPTPVLREDVTFGPMMFFLGLLLALIGVYYFFFRRSELED